MAAHARRRGAAGPVDRDGAPIRRAAPRRCARGVLVAALLWPALAILARSGLAETSSTAAARKASPASASSLAAPALDPVLTGRLDQPGDLTLRKTSLSDALFAISEVWKVNIVVGEEVQGQVNGAFENTPLAEILNAILLPSGYSYRPIGQSLVVMKAVELGDVHPLFETATIPVRGDAKDVMDSAKLLSSPKGKVQAVASAHCLLVADFPDRVAAIRRFVSGLDQGGQIVDDKDDRLEMVYLAPQYVPAASLKESVSSVLSENGKLAVLERENRVVVMDRPGRLRLAEQVLRRVDVPRKQVRIAAYIYDVATQDLETIGINWNSAIKGRYDANGDPQSKWAIDSLTLVPFDPGTVGGAMTFLNLSRSFDIRAVVELLSQCKSSQLLADPNVVVADNEPASISIVSEIPFQQLTQTGNGGNIGTTAFREAGVKLQVTPRIAADGTILMVVEPEFSRLAGYTPESNQPIIDRRTAKTVVRVADGQTLVIGGLRQRTEANTNTGIPYLKDIPVLGYAFRSRTTDARESELIVFLRPEIVSPTQPLVEREIEALEVTHSKLDAIPPSGLHNGACPTDMPNDVAPRSSDRPRNHGGEAIEPPQTRCKPKPAPPTAAVRPVIPPASVPARSGSERDAVTKSGSGTSVPQASVQRVVINGGVQRLPPVETTVARRGTETNLAAGKPAAAPSPGLIGGSQLSAERIGSAAAKETRAARQAAFESGERERINQ